EGTFLGGRDYGVVDDAGPTPVVVAASFLYSVLAWRRIGMFVCRLALYAVGCPPLVCFLEISALTGGSAPRTPPLLFPRPRSGRGAGSHRRYRHIRPSGRLLHGARETRTAPLARPAPVPLPPPLHRPAGTAG